MARARILTDYVAWRRMLSAALEEFEAPASLVEAVDNATSDEDPDDPVVAAWEEVAATAEDCDDQVTEGDIVDAMRNMLITLVEQLIDPMNNDPGATPEDLDDVDVDRLSDELAEHVVAELEG